MGFLKSIFGRSKWEETDDSLEDIVPVWESPARVQPQAPPPVPTARPAPGPAAGALPLPKFQPGVQPGQVSSQAPLPKFQPRAQPEQAASAVSVPRFQPGARPDAAPKPGRVSSATSPGPPSRSTAPPVPVVGRRAPGTREEVIDTVAEDDLEMPEEFRGCRVVEQTLPDGKVQIFYRGADGFSVPEDAAAVLIDSYRQELATVKPKAVRSSPREGYTAPVAQMAVEPRLLGAPAAQTAVEPRLVSTPGAALLAEEVIDTLGFGDDLPPELRGASFVRRGGEFRYVTRDGTRLSKDMAEGIMERWDRDQQSRSSARIPTPSSATPTLRWGTPGTAQAPEVPVPSRAGAPGSGRGPSLAAVPAQRTPAAQSWAAAAPAQPAPPVVAAAPVAPLSAQAARSPAAPVAPLSAQAARSPAAPVAPLSVEAARSLAAPVAPLSVEAARSPAAPLCAPGPAPHPEPEEEPGFWREAPSTPTGTSAPLLADATLQTALDAPAVSAARHAAERVRSLVIGGSAGAGLSELSPERVQQACRAEIDRKRTKHRFENLLQLSEQARAILAAAWEGSRDRLAKEAARDLEQDMLVLGLFNPMTLRDIDLAEFITVARLRRSDRRRDIVTGELARRVVEEVPPALLQFLMTRAFVDRAAEAAASLGNAQEALRVVMSARLGEALDAVTGEVMRRHGIWLPGLNERLLQRMQPLIDGLLAIVR